MAVDILNERPRRKKSLRSTVDSAVQNPSTEVKRRRNPFGCGADNRGLLSDFHSRTKRAKSWPRATGGWLGVQLQGRRAGAAPSLPRRPRLFYFRPHTFLSPLLLPSILRRPALSHWLQSAKEREARIILNSFICKLQPGFLSS